MSDTEVVEAKDWISLGALVVTLSGVITSYVVANRARGRIQTIQDAVTVRSMLDGDARAALDKFIEREAAKVGRVSTPPAMALFGAGIIGLGILVILLALYLHFFTEMGPDLWLWALGVFYAAIGGVIALVATLRAR